MLAVETTETHSLLQDHAIVAWLVALVGTVAVPGLPGSSGIEVCVHWLKSPRAPGR